MALWVAANDIQEAWEDQPLDGTPWAGRAVLHQELLALLNGSNFLTSPTLMGENFMRGMVPRTRKRNFPYPNLPSPEDALNRAKMIQQLEFTPTGYEAMRPICEAKHTITQTQHPYVALQMWGTNIERCYGDPDKLITDSLARYGKGSIRTEFDDQNDFWWWFLGEELIARLQSDPTTHIGITMWFDIEPHGEDDCVIDNFSGKVMFAQGAFGPQYPWEAFDGDRPPLKASLIAYLQTRWIDVSKGQIKISNNDTISSWLAQPWPVLIAGTGGNASLGHVNMKIYKMQIFNYTPLDELVEKIADMPINLECMFSWKALSHYLLVMAELRLGPESKLQNALLKVASEGHGLNKLIFDIAYDEAQDNEEAAHLRAISAQEYETLETICSLITERAAAHTAWICAVMEEYNAREKIEPNFECFYSEGSILRESHIARINEIYRDKYAKQDKDILRKSKIVMHGNNELSNSLVGSIILAQY